jgi:hypothetical protein
MTGILVALWLMALQGCSLIFQGHHLDDADVAAIQLDITTEQDLKILLGTPDAVIYKRAEQITIYQYKDLHVMTVAIPVVPITVGRAKQNGMLLNIILKDGKVIDFEQTNWTEHFFRR